MMKHPRPVFIGLVGPSGSGKTTICEYLEAEYHFNTMHVASPLKWAFCRMFDCSIAYTERPLIDQPADFLGGVKPRVVLEHMGQCIHAFAPEALPRTLVKRIDGVLRQGATRILIDGIRRATEIVNIHDRGGVVWRLGRGTVDTDKPCDLSQAEIICDHVIEDMPIPDLHAHLDSLVAPILRG
jgi:hypothetical protein